jgi:polar amino acid transport system substrate-binding protein
VFAIGLLNQGNSATPPFAEHLPTRAWRPGALIGLLLLLGGAGILVFLKGNNAPHLPYEYLRVGFSQEAPYAYVDSSGRVTGECPEELRAIVKKLGVDSLQWRMMEFGSLITALQTGRIDVVASGLFITPERAREVAFSSPTLDVRSSFLLVHKGSFNDVNSYADLLRIPEVRIAVLFGAVEAVRLRQSGISPSAMHYMPDVLTALDALRRHEVDCIALSKPTVNALALEQRSSEQWDRDTLEEIDLSAESFHGHIGFAFRLSDSMAVQLVNGVLESFVGSPEHVQIMHRFGFSSTDLPSEKTLGEALQELKRVKDAR